MVLRPGVGSVNRRIFWDEERASEEVSKWR
jgi:hypothetical protein